MTFYICLFFFVITLYRYTTDEILSSKYLAKGNIVLQQFSNEVDLFALKPICPVVALCAHTVI